MLRSLCDLVPSFGTATDELGVSNSLGRLSSLSGSPNGLAAVTGEPTWHARYREHGPSRRQSRDHSVFKGIIDATDRAKAVW